MAEFWGLVAVAMALAAACATAVTLAIKLGDARVDAAKQGARGDSLLLQNGSLTRQLGVEAAGRVDDQQRYEGVIAGLKAEVARLEKEMDQCLEPTSVRDRLAPLLAPKEPASGG